MSSQGHPEGDFRSAQHEGSPVTPPASGFDESGVFRTLFAAYPDALVMVDAQGRIVLANPAASTLLGYTNEELVGLPVEALVPDAIRPRHAAYRDAYGRAPKARPMGTQTALVARRRDGSEVMVEIALSPLQEHGLPFVVAAVRGIGEYPRVQQALQRARYSEWLAQFGRLAVDTRDPLRLLAEVPRVAAGALEAAQACVYLLDADRLEFRVASGMGLPAQGAVGTRVPNRPHTLPGKVDAAGAPVIVDDTGHDSGVDIPASGLGSGVASALAVPLSDRGRTVGVLAVLANTARRFGDDETRFLDALSSMLGTSLQRAQSEEALSHAQRLESVGQLTGGIAHDFNNLLTVISGNLQVLQDLPATAADPLSQQMIGAAARAARRGSELTGKLLAFSRRQVLQPASVDVHALVNSLADMLRRTVDQHIAITVDVAADCPPCRADPGQLESALLNIAINARDAMPEGGRLHFSARALARLPPRVHAELPGAADEHWVSIAVGDSGTGMSEAVKERAFEPFYTTKEAGRGTGLGLSTVYGFARQSRGAVAIDSSPGSGTTVTLYLPRQGVSTAAAARAPLPPLQQVPPGLRVLLVEDDPEVRDVTQRFLDAMGCRVTACGGAEQALAWLDVDSDAAPFDLLLTDIALGAGLRGTEVAKRARGHWPALPVLLMTGYSSELLGATPPWPLLRKPFDRSALAAAIASAL
jgi:PAS domain S-box-containing protein